MSAMRPMGRPRQARMLYYDDARHAYLYTVEPPPEELDVLHPVDVVCNSMVDTFVFGFGIGPTMSYGTRVGESGSPARSTTWPTGAPAKPYSACSNRGWTP